MAADSQALRLHPENPHYFEFRGKPTVLITSAEHYGAVMNQDFDYSKFLETLAKHHFNLTRLFTGAAYCEPSGAFGITENTLAPKKGRFLPPWKRSDQPGAWDGGTKWDLTAWNEHYFYLLKDFVSLASQHGIIVEVNLFCPFYEDKSHQSKMWPLSPFHPDNNINGLGNILSHDVYTMDKHGGLLEVQERFVRQVVESLKEFDNVYYEICNEPYFAGVTLEWQHHMADVISEALRKTESPKLISQNIANGSAHVENPHPAVSIFNFHYTYPPKVVAENSTLNKVIGENETGFRGNADEVYRNEAWDFLMAGGALFNNLDYSFAVGHEDGSYAYPPRTPGGGGPSFWSQLEVLVNFMNSLDFVKMRPAAEFITAVSNGASLKGLANPGVEYAFYLHHSAAPGWTNKTKLQTGNFADRFTLLIPEGSYELEWIEPRTGEELRKESREHGEGLLELTSPKYTQDVALHIRRKVR